MSQQLAGYMDGVPVKISEKYKPPPAISVPSGLFESVARLDAELRAPVPYRFELERNVLRKLQEWRDARDTLGQEREHRLRVRAEARQRQQDLLAATQSEERLKQLSVSEVSYPSTDEISDISPDDCTESEQPDPRVSAPEEPECADDSSNLISDIRNVYAEKNKCDETINILKPTQAPVNGLTARVNLLDDLDPITQYQLSTRIKSNKFIRSGTFYDKSVVDKLSFSDFENDTSSPFDNLELKTMNDLELLAQVLNTQTSSAAVNETAGGFAELSLNQKRLYNIEDPSAVEPINSNIYATERIIPYSTVNGPEYYSSYGNAGSYVGAANPMPTTNYYSGEFPMYVNSDGANNGYYRLNYVYPTANPAYRNVSTINNYEPTNKDGAMYGESNKINPQADANNYSSVIHSNFNIGANDSHKLYNTNYSSYIPINDSRAYEQNQSDYSQNGENKVTNPSTINLLRSRSRSVPDIVKELDDEVAGARMKSRERSHNCSPSPHVADKPEAPPSRLPNKENLPNPFDNLSPRLQLMCKNISGMGFPLERVARACDNIGEDDKKVIEYLLIMGQLMDLGFMESNVAKSLLKHDCNRDKALDELIS